MRDELLSVAVDYLRAIQEPFASNRVADHIRTEVPAAVRRQMSADYGDLIIKGSAGQGVWAAIPWVAFFDPLETTSATYGLYVVYLFSADMERLYLSLNQGTTAVYHEFGPRYGRQVLRSRADLMFNRVKEHTKAGMAREIDLASDGSLALGYEAGHAIGYVYDLAAIPSDIVLAADLDQVLKLYRHLLFRGGVMPSDTLLETGGVKDIEEAHRYQMVRKLERNPKVRKQVLALKDPECEGCGLAPLKDYALPSTKLPLDVHHLMPLSDLQEGARVTYKVPDDFAVLCPTCHRVVHQMEDPGDIETLRQAVRFKHARLME
jgi:5-methylcytosine-specific restriction protein A